MNFIKSLNIYGFKKFEELHINFNEHLNILVGENESGKTTILEAINIVLNQKYRNADKSVLRDLFNLNQVRKFNDSPSVGTLPIIKIELIFSLDDKGKNSHWFWGENNLTKEENFGILFECKFDEQLGSGLDSEIADGKIPYEYYDLTWKAFNGLSYVLARKPFSFISIDTSSTSGTDAFNYYNKTLFNSKYEDIQKISAKNRFRNNLQAAFKNIELPQINDKQYFGINDKKVPLESILSIYEDDISLENKGAGMECFIKTKIALDKQNSNIDVILIEEPENHLSFGNMKKMIAEIEARKGNSQILITTHSNMIASSLNLKNVLWLNEQNYSSLDKVSEEVSDFFVKAENNNFLQLLLSEKVFLVEGATEYMLLPQMYKTLTSSTLEEDNISVIACNGISYKNYLEIAKNAQKKVAVITDNDEKQGKINDMKSFNNDVKNINQHIFMDSNVANWTWEICFFNENKVLCEKLIKIENDANYTFKGKTFENKHLGKMLNNKVESAYKILCNGKSFNIPQYIKDAVEWLRK